MQISELFRWLVSTPGSDSVDGFCYGDLVNRRDAAVVKSLLGEWPCIESLMGLDARCMRPLDEVEWLFAVGGVSFLHLQWAVDVPGAEDWPLAVSVLKEVAMKRPRVAGTYGELLVNSEVGRFTGFVSGATRVGGKVLPPKGAGEAAIMAYNWAVASYNGLCVVQSCLSGVVLPEGVGPVQLEVEDVKPSVRVESVSESTLANRRKREEKKIRKQKNQSMGNDWRKRSHSREKAFPVEVDASWVERKKAENKLKAAQAERQLLLLQARDVEEDKVRQAKKQKAEVAKHMVDIEKTFATLRATDNVPSSGGCCETVAAGVSISPDSSASLAEVRAVQKALLDTEKELVDTKRMLESRSLEVKGLRSDIAKGVVKAKAFRDLQDGHTVAFTTVGEGAMLVSESVENEIVRLYGRTGVDYGVDPMMGGTWFKKVPFSDGEIYE